MRRPIPTTWQPFPGHTRDGRTRDVLALAIVSVLCYMAHAFAVVVLGVLAIVALIAFKERKRAFFRLAVAAAPVTIFLLLDLSFGAFGPVEADAGATPGGKAFRREPGRQSWLWDKRPQTVHPRRKQQWPLA